jgi:hypothetical protein
MSTRDEPSLTERERAALAGLESLAAAEDPQLAKRLAGASRLRLIAHVPRITAWLHTRWWAVPLLVVGVAFVVVGLGTTVVLSIVGSILMAGGLWLTAGAVERRWIKPRSST